MDLFNAKTRLKESIQDPELLQQALQAKTHSFAVGQEIPATDPYGNKVWVRSEDVHNLANEGYRFLTSNQREVENFVNENKGPIAGLGVGLAQAADEFALGLPELLYNHGASALDVAKKEALKKEHGIANAIGGTAGFIGSLGFGIGPKLFAKAAAARKGTEAVTKHLAEKLGVTTAEQVGKRTLRNTAANLGARTLGTAAEGAVISSPHAVTEFVLGDPDAAAQHLMGGLGVGALFGLGTGLGGEAFKLTKKIYNDLAEKAKQKEINTAWVSRKLAQTFTGVPEENIRYYMDNLERLQKNPPPPRENLINEIDQAVRPYENRVKNLEHELKTSRTSQSIADELQLSLESIKKREGQLSEEADGILSSLPGGESVSDLIKFVEHAKEKYIPVEVGKVAKGAAKELDDIIFDLKRLEKPAELSLAEKEYYGIFADYVKAQIPYPMVRDIWQAVRKNVGAWGQAEFNTVSDAALKNISSDMRKLVRGKSPEFEQIMSEMADLAELHRTMLKRGFGDRNKAASVFDKIVKKQAEIDTDLLAKYDERMGTNFSNEVNRYNFTKAQLDQAERVYEPIKILSFKSIENVIKNQGYKNPKHIYNLALKDLEAKTGIPFQEKIRDFNVVDSFNKASTQGSRKAVAFGRVGGALGTGLGTAAGAVMGGAPGAAVGAAGGGVAGHAIGSVAGMIADVYGGQVLKSALDSESKLGLLFVEKALKQNAAKIDGIPGMLERLSKMKPQKFSTETTAINALWRMLEATDTKEHKNKSLGDSVGKLSEIMERVSEMLSSPERMHDSISRITEGLTSGGAPQIGFSFAMVSQNVLNYIYKNLPKPPKPPSAFERQIKWRPPDYEIFDFAQKLQVLENPFIVLDLMEQGTLTSNHMDALHSVFPSIFKEIQAKFQQIAMSGVAQPLNYSQRVKLSLLLDMPLDSSLQSADIKYFQSTFVEQPEQKQQNTVSFKPQNLSKDLSDNNLTQYQSLLQTK